MTTPDNWVIIQIKGDNPHYRVLAGWSGGYATGDSWQLNSGITKVEDDGAYWLFHGSSGSVYRCHKDAYGLRMNNAYIWDKMKDTHGDKVHLMDEENEWTAIDWGIE